MARFAGKKEKSTPELNMGSMSDIIFMLLFFFMVITTMRESPLYVKIINILLLNKSIPSFKTDGDKTKGGTKKIKADKPMHANQFFGMFAKRIEK